MDLIGTCFSSITLPLQPQEEAKLIAIAQAKGLSADALVREVLEKLLADMPDVNPKKRTDPVPTRDSLDQNRAGMFANFARD